MRMSFGILLSSSARRNMAAKRSAAGRDVDLDFYSVQENSGSNSNVPAFLMKLWTLVEDPSNNDIICWDMVS